MASSLSSNDSQTPDMHALQEHGTAGSMPLPKIPLDSFSNALVLLPPTHIQSAVNALRCANDKSYPRWTAHLTVVFPFVGTANLPFVLEFLRSELARAHLQPFQICLDTVGRFRQRDYETVYLGSSQYTGATPSPVSGNGGLHQLWTVLSNGIGYKGRPFVPHMTLGQTSHRKKDIQLLESKGKRILATAPLEWTVDRVYVLQKDDKDGGKMKIIDELLLNDSDPNTRFLSDVSDIQSTYHFDSSADAWVADKTSPRSSICVSQLTITTFNILHPPLTDCVGRFESIRDVLLDVGGDVVCLQEVTDEFLDRLLQDRDVCAKWAWCTNTPKSPMENERNVVVLSSDHLPFSWNRVSLGGRRKVAPILSLRITGSRPEDKDNDNTNPITVCLAAIHLSAGLTPQNLETKAREFATLLSYLQKNHPDDEWIIAGDTNFPSRFNPSLPPSSTAIVRDIWESFQNGENCGDTRFGVETYNATFDPTQNVLASQSSRSVKSPQRYDRIYLKSSGCLVPNSLEVLRPHYAQIASDHWPVRARFTVSPGISNGLRDEGSSVPQAASIFGDNPSATEHSCLYNPVSPISLDEDLLAFLRTSNAIPTSEQEGQREEIMRSLRTVIGASDGNEVQAGSSEVLDLPDKDGGPARRARSSVMLVLVLVGSAAMGVDLPDSDLDCIVVGNVNTATFWELCKQRIASLKKALGTETDSQHKVLLRRFVKDAAVQMMVLEVGGKKVDLQYCPAAALTESWDASKDLSMDANITLSVPTMKVLNAHRDRQCLQRFIPSYPAFQSANRLIKLVCQRRGLYSARFGYLGGIHISILLSRIAELKPDLTAASELTKEFFKVYSSFDWVREIASVANVDTTYRRSPKEPIVILSPLKPVVNVARNASLPTTQTIQEEFHNINDLLHRGMSWNEVCSDNEQAISSFLGTFQCFIKLDLNYWGDDCMDARALIGYVESRIVQLLVDLQTADSRATFRFWPERFTDTSPINEVKRSTIQGFYLIGVRQTFGEKGSPGTRSLSSAINAFEDSIHSNSNYYDTSEAFLVAHEVIREALPHAVYVDEVFWLDGGVDNDPDESTIGDDGIEVASEDHDLHDRSTPSEGDHKEHGVLPGSSHHDVHVVPSEGSSKLRPSTDVFNRLMWDAQYDANDYSIGYMDRFAGIMETPLRSWSRDIDEENWIPFHRIVYFRCKSNGEIVWNRQKRIDRVFGSG